MPDKPRQAWCPFHSTLNNPQVFGHNHPCFTIYEVAPA